VRAARVLLAGLLLASLLGCGEASKPRPPGPWRSARLDGLPAATGVALLREGLLFVAGGERALFHVRRADLVDGAALRVRRVPLVPDREAFLGGGDRFAAHGYRLGQLWDDSLDVQGVAASPPDHVWLAERRYRVLYAGRLVEDEQGGPREVRLTGVSSVPGGVRGSAWLDEGSGLADLAAVDGERVTEDLYAVERGADGVFSLFALDRMGVPLSRWTVRFPDGAGGEAGGLTREGAGFLVLTATGSLHAVVGPAAFSREVAAGAAEPGPNAVTSGPWSGLARGPDGTLYAVSSAPQPTVAWRPPAR
jgi:hypothetical protein